MGRRTPRDWSWRDAADAAGESGYFDVYEADGEDDRAGRWWDAEDDAVPAGILPWLPERDLASVAGRGASAAEQGSLDAREISPFIIPGLGKSMGIGFMPRRKRPLAMHLVMIVLAVCVVFTGLFAVAPLNWDGAQT